MSVWKKASKSNQKTHRERHQPEDRKHLGLLEKKNDYKKRANDFNEKQDTLKLLRKRALNKNPDEFYHHMINSKVEDGMHFEKETEDEDTPEQMKLMQTQDLKYVVTKRTQEKKKIEKLQSQLHLISVRRTDKNKHVYFKKNLDQASKPHSLKTLATAELPTVDLDILKEASISRKALIKQLGKRISREKELSVVQQKIEMNKHIENRRNVLKPRKVVNGTKESAPVYVWKYERKR